MRPTHAWSRCIAFALVPGLLPAADEPPPPPQRPPLSLEEILNVKVAVASRTETSIIDAPSVVSVFTAEEIRRMGARDIRDVLRTVPGFELGIRNFGYPEFGLRGLISDSTEKIRILLDGVPINENLEGSGTIIFGDLTLDNVERIEIIRGPGSALYGTNAFVGVISILTKRPPAWGTASTLTARAGSFRTGEGSMLTGWSGPKLRVSAFLHYLDTEGPKSSVGQDALQLGTAPPWFSNLNSGISLAGTSQGRTDEFRRKLTAQLRMEFGDYFLNGAFVDAKKGPYFGTLWALNQHSEAHPYQAQGAAGAKLRAGDHWTFEPQVYVLHYKADNLWNGAPDGYRVPDGSGGFITYTKGRYDRNGGTQDTRGVDLKTTWAGDSGHKVVLGASYEQQKLYRVVNETNVPGFGPERMVDAGAIIQKNPDRSLTSAYLQDQWSPLPTLGITAGVRMDRYDDAGTAVTPRLAFVWRPQPPLTVKLLYGEAFRAPTFVESYLYAYSGFVVGNAGNKPEKIKSGELEASYRFGDLALWRVVLFHNRITDLIHLLPTAGHLEYRNIADATVVKGLETDLKLTFSRAWSGFANYSCQSGRNEVTGELLLGTANWRANAGLNWAPLEQLNLNFAYNIVGRRQRAAGDPRPELKGYQVADLALTYSPRPSLELSLTAHNLFDADQRFQDVSGPLPGDFPWEGRNLQVGIRWSF